MVFSKVKRLNSIFRSLKEIKCPLGDKNQQLVEFTKLILRICVFNSLALSDFYDLFRSKYIKEVFSYCFDFGSYDIL